MARSIMHQLLINVPIISAGAYNQDIDKRLARNWSGHTILSENIRSFEKLLKYKLHGLS